MQGKKFDSDGQCDNNSSADLPGDVEYGLSEEDDAQPFFEEQWSAAPDPSGICLIDQEMPCEAQDVRDTCREPPCHSDQNTNIEQEIGQSAPSTGSKQSSKPTRALYNASPTHRQESRRQEGMTAVPLVPVIPVDHTTAMIVGEGNQSTPRHDRFSQNQRAKCLLCGATLAIVLVAAVVGGVCGSGKCTAETDSGNSKASSESPTLSPTAQSSTLSPTEQSSAFRSFTTTQELYLAVDTYLNLTKYLSPNSSEFNSSDVCDKYGCPIGIWDVSNIKDFSGVFDPQRNLPLTSEDRLADLNTFNENLSEWDMSSATSLSGMFAYTSAFEGYSIENWNVSSVVDMSFLFFHAKSFNANLSKWDTSHVVSMAGLFGHAQSFVGSDTLSSWNTSSLVELGAAFAEASSFNGTLSGLGCESRRIYV
jgi:hypothetical protein